MGQFNATYEDFTIAVENAGFNLDKFSESVEGTNIRQIIKWLESSAKAQQLDREREALIDKTRKELLSAAEGVDTLIDNLLTNEP